VSLIREGAYFASTGYWLRSRVPPSLISLHQSPCHTELPRRPGPPYLLPNLSPDRRLSGNALRSGQHQPLRLGRGTGDLPDPARVFFD
jgi:hypothetical protein